jgi:hypothetical protein
MAVTNLMEYVAVEEPDVRITTIHPGGQFNAAALEPY